MIRSVLVVDDYEPWRRHIEATIRDHPHWQIVGEASDGFDAIAKARDLGPDLILLDIGLPGDRTASTPRGRSSPFDPGARILFMSEHRSWDIVRAAMRTGARGYIPKAESRTRPGVRHGRDHRRAADRQRRRVGAGVHKNGAGADAAAPP